MGYFEWEVCANFELSAVAFGPLKPSDGRIHKPQFSNLHSQEEVSIRAQNVITAGSSKGFSRIRGLEAMGGEGTF
jgi:hypothetical protein